MGISYINFTFDQPIYNGVVIESKDSYFIFDSKLEKIYVPFKNNTYEIGDILSITGEKEELYFYRYESDFDFKDYLNKKGVYYQLNIKTIEPKFLNPIRINSYRKFFLSHFDENTSSFISNVLFSCSINSQVKETLSVLHLNKLLSTSGFYIHLFDAFFIFLFTFFFKKKWAKLASISLLSIYFVFTFPKFSVLRFLVLTIFRWINEYKLNKKFSNLEIISLSGLLFIILNYHLVYTEGFILGYLIPITSFFINGALQGKKKWKKKLISTLLILCLFIPFEFKFYNELSLLSYPMQIILSPLCILAAFSSLLCFFMIPLYTPTNMIVGLLGKIATPLSKITINVYAPKMNEAILIIFLILYFLGLYYYTVKFKPFYPKIYACIATLLTLYVLPINNLISEEVSFINVGQGDACLIRKGSASILIDTGGSIYKDIANDVLIPYFKKKRIYNLDLVITTHDDYDHSGALTELNANFHIHKYINGYNSFPLSINGITFTNYNIHINEYSDENEQSLVIGFHLSNYDFLIMGDAPSEIEKRIMNDFLYIPCDILKVGHHGSNTSTSDSFIKYISPKEGVISVGRNYYGHPSSKVIKILKDNNVKIRSTLDEGTINYYSYSFLTS